MKEHTDKEQEPPKHGGVSDDTTAATSSSLERRYLYQNPTDGKVSSTTLTVRQLCRIFSPPASATSRFNSETQLLALEPDGRTYDPEGWKPAGEVPVLRHAAFNSFFYTHHTTAAPQGPVSCRQLSTVRFGTEDPIDPAKDQVYGESTGNQWTLWMALPDLEVAMEAFRDQVTAQNFDVSMMIYETDVPQPIGEATAGEGGNLEKQVQDELEAFLSSTAGKDTDEGEEEGYQSDGGTMYVKDPRTGKWIHQALAPQKETAQPPPNKKVKTKHDSTGGQAKKRDTKGKFSAKNAKRWIYITGLPPDTTEEELAKFFSKVGIIDLDPETQRPKIKVYRHKTDTKGPDGAVVKAGACKGDASICYARPESVTLALQVLDEAPFRDFVHTQENYRLSVQNAKFEQMGEYSQRKRISEAQRKVAKLAVKQARDWDEGEFNGRLTGGLKGLRIIVLKGLFHPDEFHNGDEEEEDALLAELERKVATTSEEFGTVEKITVFSKNPQGVLVVKFAQPGAASEAVKAWDGKSFYFGKQSEVRKVKATFWDGVEDFTVADEVKEVAEMEKRHDAFGEWIESHAEDELPDELRLKVEN